MYGWFGWVFCELSFRMHYEDDDGWGNRLGSWLYRTGCSLYNKAGFYDEGNSDRTSPG